MLRTFGLSTAATVAALVAAFLYGGTPALALCAILGVLEVSLSFDNAVVNATVLGRMSDYWQKVFLTVGVFVAAVGMRFLLPVVVVWATAGLNPPRALALALHPPTDGSPTYESYLHQAHPMIAAFGGMFLLMLFLGFVLDDERETHWLSWLERPLARLGIGDLSWAVAGTALVVASVTVVPADHRVVVLVAGLLGLIGYSLVDHLGERFDTGGDGSGAVKAVGKAAFFTFLYLEVLDASFSFDGVMGAFAVTADPVLIMLGLGFIGAMFIRSLTVFLVREGTLAEYVYLEHGAQWAIGALSVLMLLSSGVHVNEIATGLVGVVLIGAAFASSVLHRRRAVPEPVEPAKFAVLDLRDHEQEAAFKGALEAKFAEINGVGA